MMPGGQDYHPEAGFFKNPGLLPRLEDRWLKNRRALGPVAMFLTGEGIEAEMDKGGHFLFLPFYLPSGRHNASSFPDYHLRRAGRFYYLDISERELRLT